MVSIVASLLLWSGWERERSTLGQEEPESGEVAERLYRAGKWEQAYEAFARLQPRPEGELLAELLRKMAYCQERQNAFEAATETLRNSLAIKEAEPSTRAALQLRLGYCLRRLGEGEQAIKVLQQAANNPHASSTVAAEAWLYAAWEHGTRDQWDEALAKFRQVEQVADVHANYIATARLSIGKILQRREEYPSAIEIYRSIDQLTPVAATNRARARVYRLECEALLQGDVAFHIRPYVSHVDERSANIYWVSQGAVESGRVRVALQDDDSSAVRQFEPQLLALKDTKCRLHTAEVRGLAPGRSYRYEIRCEGETQRGSFRTAPLDDRPFQFCVIGDTQSYHPALQPLLDAMGNEESDFVLHVGDITDRGNLWGEWKACFFDPGREYLQDSVFWPAYGNHDGGPYFPALFDLTERYYYSFDYGNAHFIILDSYGAGSGGAGRQRQLEWLKQDLRENDKTWTIVALHVPMIATRRRLQWFGAEDFLPLLEEHEVDIVFSGHHPHYRRYYPIGGRGKRPILHVTSGGGGGPVGGSMPSPLLAQGINVNHYCKLRIAGERLTLTAHAISGSVIDRFEIKKDPQQLLLSTRDALKAGQTVASEDARKIISLYEELLTDRAYHLILHATSQPEPGEPISLTLDLKQLPRGPLATDQFAEDTELWIRSVEDDPWQIETRQSLLASGKIVLEGKCPKEATQANGRVSPAAQVELQLEHDGKKLAPFRTTADIRY